MINVGFIGCGRIADLHAPAYLDHKEARLYAVCDVDKEKAQARKQAWGAQVAYENYRDLLADPNIHAVEILTPYDAHEETVVAAAEAGKHIACQKPMTTNLKSALRMGEAVRKAGVKFQLTEIYMHYPPISRAKQLIDDGAIGEPAGMRFDYVASPRGGWDVPPSTYQQQTRIAGAGFGLSTFDHGHHEWATAWLLLGEPERVTAWIDSNDGVLDAPAVVMWKCKGNKRYGVCDYFFASDMNIPTKYYSNDELYYVVGSRGILHINRGTGDIMTGPPLALFDGHSWRCFDDMPTDWGQGFINAGRHFVDVILGKAAPRLSFDQGVGVLRFALAIMESARKRREVYLDELDSPWPALLNWSRRRRDSRECIVAPRGKARSWLGGDASRYAPQAKELTDALVQRFDGAAVPDWKCTIALELLDKQGASLHQYGFFFDRGALVCEQGRLPETAGLTVHIDAGLWAAILLKKKRIEMALIQGKIKYEGRGEEGLYLKKAFHF